LTLADPGGFMALFSDFGVTFVGLVGYRGLQLGTSGTTTGLNPYNTDSGFLGTVTTFATVQTAITFSMYERAALAHGLSNFFPEQI
jgi:hypothetical protein